MKSGSAIKELWITIRWFIKIYAAWLFRCLRGRVKQRSSKQPVNTENLAQSIRERQTGSRIKILRQERTAPSNSIRPSSSAVEEDISTKDKATHFVNLGAANTILNVDRLSKTVTCEPGVTMEQLVDELLPYNLVPAVVPEFKSLTVGGVLAGAGLESSSFRYGQFGDLLIEATYILSDSRIITCSPTKDSDLFYGALGACGTFALLVSATLRVVNANADCFVRCNYLQTNRPIESLSSLYCEDYIDAIVFSDYTIIITGDRVDRLSLPKTGKIQTFSKAWDPWYYEHVKTVHRNTDLTVITEYVPLKDYLFRYDRGAFWMGRYPLNPLQDIVPHLPRFIRNLVNFFPFGGYNTISRTLLSPLFTTSSLFERLHASPISVIADTLLIQDVYIPKSKSKQFLSFVKSGKLFMQDGGILEAIWLCPIRSTQTPQKMSPHFYNNSRNVEDSSFINFGLWTHQHSWQSGTSQARSATKILEREIKRLGGRKMLYSLSYYSRREWSNIYDVQWYKAMKKKWDSDCAWGDLYDKVVDPS